MKYTYCIPGPLPVDVARSPGGDSPSNQVPDTESAPVELSAPDAPNTTAIRRRLSRDRSPDPLSSFGVPGPVVLSPWSGYSYLSVDLRREMAQARCTSPLWRAHPRGGSTPVT